MLKKQIKSLGLAVLLAGHSVFASSTTEVWNHHIQAWKARSVEAIVSDYTDESVLVLNNQIFKGPDQIAHVFTQLFKIFDDGVNRIDKPVLFERFVYITWHFSPAGKKEYFGTDTFVVEGGKILLQTIASSLYEEFPVSAIKRTQMQSNTNANSNAIVLKNQKDLKWERMLPDLGDDSPQFAILRVDPKTKATTLMIEFPKAIYIPKHTHKKSETHFILGGSHLFESEGKRFDVKEHGYIYMPGKFVHEAWVPAGAKAIIILENGWKVDWLKEGPTKLDLGKVPPLF